MPTRTLRSVLAALLALTLLLTACSDNRSANTVAAAAPPAVAPAVPAKSEAAAEKGFAVSGPLIVEHQLDVLSQRDGVVTRLLVDEGTRVKEGEILAQLDDRQILADLEAARAKTLSTEDDLNNWKSEAKVLEADYQRAQKMWEAQITTREELDHAKFKAEADQWDVKRVEELLVNAQQTERSLGLEMEKTRIRSPFSGIVARRYVRDGQQVAKGDRLFWVTAEAPLRMRFTLPEKLFGSFHQGQTLPLTSPDVPEHNYQARVTEISPVIDAASGTFEVAVELEGNTSPLRPGMTASISLDHRQ
jgi:membrane fusion protein (multidrug efflux system)